MNFLDKVGLRPGMACMDVGCGGGDVTRELARRVGAGFNGLNSAKANDSTGREGKGSATGRSPGSIALQSNNSIAFGAHLPVLGAAVRTSTAKVPGNAAACHALAGSSSKGLIERKGSRIVITDQGRAVLAALSS